jgi:Lon protease-like protein
VTDRDLEVRADDLDALAVFPLPNVVLLPGALLPLHVFEPRYREMAADVIAGRRRLAVARLQPGFEDDYEGRPPIHPICGLGGVMDFERRADGRYDILLVGLARVRVVAELPPTHAYRVVRAALLEDVEADGLTVAAYQRELVSLWTRLAPYLPAAVRDLCKRQVEPESAGAFADRIAAAVVADPDERQALLEELDPGERLCRLLTRVHSLYTALSAGKSVPGSELN